MIKIHLKSLLPIKYRFLKIAFLFMFLSFGIYGVCSLFFPLEWIEFSNRVDLWRAGVTEVWLGGEFHAYMQDRCSQTDLENEDQCSCIALIHGLGDNALTWKKLLTLPEEKWRKAGMMSPLRLAAIDLVGAGGTPAPSDPKEYQVRRQAKKLQLALASTCRRWILVGNSYGGWIASWLALDWPTGVKRLLLFNSAGIKQMRENSFAPPTTLEGLKEFQRRAYFRPQEIPDFMWTAIFKRLKSSPILQIAQAQTEEDYLDLSLPTLRVPTLLSWGKADQVIPLALGYQLRALIPTAAWREVNECGHLPQKECPEFVIQSIIDMTNFGSI